jgi:Bacterial Ig-like domain (group 2)
MKLLKPLSLLLLTGLVLGCGAGHPKITSIIVSPAMATSAINSNATVAFTATGNFDNHTSRQLTVADGLTWKTSNTAIAGINDTGEATCIAAGSATVTATAPSQLVITVGTQISNNSPKVNGTATLNCT